MMKFRLMLKIGLTAAFGLASFFLPVLLMVMIVKYVIGFAQMAGLQFFVVILGIAGISFIFAWWFDNRFKNYKLASNLVDKCFGKK